MNMQFCALPRGVESTHERGCNLISCCTLYYQTAHSIYKGDADERRILRSMHYLTDMGVSLYQPNFQGTTPVDYLRETGLGKLADELLESTQEKEQSPERL